MMHIASFGCTDRSIQLFNSIVHRCTLCRRQLLYVDADRDDHTASELGTLFQSASRRSAMWISWRTLPGSDIRSVVGRYCCAQNI